MMDRVGATKKIFVMILILLPIAYLTHCAFTGPTPERELRIVRARIPVLIAFYYENEEFFDLLLDLHRRFVESIADNEDDNFSVEVFIMDIFQDELNVSTQGPSTSGIFYPGNNPDFLSPYERKLIETTLMSRKGGLRNDRWLSAQIWEHFVSISVLSYSMSSFGIRSPVLTTEELQHTAIMRGTTWIMYASEINEDWMVSVQMHFR